MNYEDLTPELKEKALACKTPEELDGIAGGLECSWYCIMVVTCENVAKPQT